MFRVDKETYHTIISISGNIQDDINNCLESFLLLIPKQFIVEIQYD